MNNISRSNNLVHLSARGDESLIKEHAGADLLWWEVGRRCQPGQASLANRVLEVHLLRPRITLRGFVCTLAVDAAGEYVEREGWTMRGSKHNIDGFQHRPVGEQSNDSERHRSSAC